MAQAPAELSVGRVELDLFARIIDGQRVARATRESHHLAEFPRTLSTAANHTHKTTARVVHANVVRAHRGDSNGAIAQPHRAHDRCQLVKRIVARANIDNGLSGDGPASIRRPGGTCVVDDADTGTVLR